MASSYVTLIPFTTPHGGIVIGKKGSHIQKLQIEYRCKIETKSEEPEHKRENPYFLVRAPNERDLNHVCLEIQRLLIISMMGGQNKMTEKVNTLEVAAAHHRVEIDLVISELKKELDLQRLLNREMLEDQGEEMLDPRFLEMSKNNEDLDEEELKPEKKEAKEVELFFKEIEEKGNEIYKKQL